MKHPLSILFDYIVFSFFISENRITKDGKLSGCCESPALFRLSPQKIPGNTVNSLTPSNRTSIRKPPYPFHKISVQKAALHRYTRFEVDPLVSHAVKFNFMEKVDNTGMKWIYMPPTITDRRKQLFDNRAHVTNNPCYFQCISGATFTRLQVTKSMFPEYNATCNHPAMMEHYAQIPEAINMFPVWITNVSENWNKICVYLTPC